MIARRVVLEPVGLIVLSGPLARETLALSAEIESVLRTVVRHAAVAAGKAKLTRNRVFLPGRA